MKEIRTMTLTPIQRSEEEGDNGAMIVEGYAAVFNSRTLLWESEYSGYRYMEEIAPGAFDGADLSRTVFKYNHDDSGLVLARASNNTLSLSTDEHGLKVRAEIADTTTGRDLYTLIKRGDLDKMSFGFTISGQTVEEDKENKEYIRRITAFDTIYDVSVVDFPAYDDTSIEARSDQAEFFKELEKKEMAERRRKLMLMTMC